MLKRSSFQRAIYELRTYHIKPSGVPLYAAKTKELLHLRTAHSKLLGFWGVELGGINQFVHIWEYDSLQHRKDVRAALAADATWSSEYIEKVRETWDTQSNQLLIAEKICDLSSSNAKSNGCYKLVTTFDTLKRKDIAACEVLGVWRISAGLPLGQYVTLLYSSNMDDLCSIPRVLDGTYAEAKIMLPAPFLSHIPIQWS